MNTQKKVNNESTMGGGLENRFSKVKNRYINKHIKLVTNTNLCVF